MKTIMLFLVLAVPVMAQDPDARTSAGCGPSDFKFNIKTVKSDHGITRPEPGKSLFYVIEEVQQATTCLIKCLSTVRVGVDGTWVAAVKHDSYALFSVEPGDHHVCGNWKFPIGFAIRLSAIDVKAQPDNTYYFVIELSYSGPDNRRGFIKLKSIDAAEGQALISTRKFTTLEPKH